jgi:hypothetical protein
MDGDAEATRRFDSNLCALALGIEVFRIVFGISCLKVFSFAIQRREQSPGSERATGAKRASF